MAGSRVFEFGVADKKSLPLQCKQIEPGHGEISSKHCWNQFIEAADRPDDRQVLGLYQRDVPRPAASRIAIAIRSRPTSIAWRHQPPVPDNEKVTGAEKSR